MSADSTIGDMQNHLHNVNSSFILLKALCLLGLLSFSQISFAEQWYHVELVVFEQLDSVSDEQAPVARVPNASFDPNTTNDMMQPAANKTLTGSASRLKKSPRYQVHYHQSWKQPIKTKANAKSIAINNSLINGRVRLHKGTYLYATVDLQLDRVTQTDDWSEVGGQRRHYLKETRRVRRDKLHFFDHPHLGALLKLTPI